MSDKILFCTCAKMILFTTSELKLYLITSAINYTTENYYVKLISLNFPGGGEGGGSFRPLQPPSRSAHGMVQNILRISDHFNDFDF